MGTTWQACGRFFLLCNRWQDKTRYRDPK
jgi:hypothetical protein